MEATTRLLHSSALGGVVDFRCHCDHDRPSEREFTPMPSITFVRRGAFNYREGRHAEDFHSGVMLVSPRPAEYVVTHLRGIRDDCTIILLPRLHHGVDTPNHNRRFAALPVTPVLAHLHHALLAAAADGSRVRTDELLGALTDEVARLQGGGARPVPLDRRTLVRYHDTIDRAKEFIHDHHTRDLSLTEIARHACLSPFHFSRVFRRVTGSSPHRYLTAVRLDHAALLLRDTRRPVTDVSLSTGFNSLEHFIAAFRARFGQSPSAYRAAPQKSKFPQAGHSRGR
jgi:AraC-like DNA-binding protein